MNLSITQINTNKIKTNGKDKQHLMNTKFATAKINTTGDIKIPLYSTPLSDKTPPDCSAKV